MCKYHIPTHGPYVSVHSVVKAVAIVFSLLRVLLSIPRYHFVLIQNPPCLPAVAVAVLLSLFNGSKVCVDWHNLGFTMFTALDGTAVDLSGRTGGITVKLSRFIESQLWWLCDRHLCVSRALGTWLQQEFHISSPIVVYDRPPGAVFGSLFESPDAASSNSSSSSGATSASQLLRRKHDLLMKLDLTDVALFPDLCSVQPKSLSSKTVITETDTEGRLRIRADASAIIVSSTSWTADEDFTILERSIWALDEHLSTAGSSGE